MIIYTGQSEGLSHEIMERNFVFRKVLLISALVGLVYLVKAVAYFMKLYAEVQFSADNATGIGIDMLLANLVNELICSFVISYRKGQLEHVKYTDYINIESFDVRNKKMEEDLENDRMIEEVENEDD